MSLFDLKNVKLHPQRNGFDLSQHSVVGASAGMLLPVYSTECLPGDKFELGVNSLTRMNTLNKAAFCRCKEYYDWFFVPTRLLWRFFPNFVMSLADSESTDYNLSSLTPTIAPNFYVGHLNDCIGNAITNSLHDDAGYPFVDGARRLTDLLGYGKLTSVPTSSSSVVHNYKFSPFLLAVYQKIYQDFYRNSQWEKSDSASYNFDYFDRSYSESQLTIMQEQLPHLLKLRYASHKKDLFTGLRPKMQYGDVALAPINSEYLHISSSGGSPINSAPLRVVSGGRLTAGSGETPITIDGNLSVLDLRRAEALQRFKEVTQASQLRYNAQVQAHFGYHVPDSRSQMAEYITGFDNPVVISEVVATSNGSADDDVNILGQISGKGIGVEDGNQRFTYEAKEHGFLMCIYHISPEMDYCSFGVDRVNTKLHAEDYYQPAFANLGLESVNLGQVFYSPTDGQVDPTLLLGYTVRDYDYKTKLDKVYGEFADGSLKSWVTYYSPSRLRHIATARPSGVTFSDFLVSPSNLDQIFTLRYSGQVTDQFYLNLYCDVKAVRSMPVDGMPY